MSNDSGGTFLYDKTGAYIGSALDGTTNRITVDSRLNDGSGNYATISKDGTVRRLCVDVRSSGTSAAAMVNKQLATSTGVVTISTVSGTAASPVNFFYSPAAGTTATVTRLSVFFEGTNYLQNGQSFLGASALTNGINIGATVGGQQYVFCTLKVNEDILTYSNGATQNSGTGGTLLGISLGTVTSLQFVLPLAQPLTPTDQINVWVRDNLNSIGNQLLYARATVQGYLTS